MSDKESKKKKCTCGARPWEYEECFCGNGVQPEEYYGLFTRATGITTVYDEDREKKG